MSYTTPIRLLHRLAGDIDPTAWAEFHRRYLDLIRGFAHRHGLQPADCDDVAQDVFVALSQSLSGFQYDPKKGKFRSYLKTLAIRAINRKLRQKYERRVQCDIEDEQNAVTCAFDGEVWEDEWRQYHIRLAMGRLTGEFNERDRMAFTRYAILGQSAAQTAEALGMSLDQVYQAKSRILKRLAERIAQQVEEEG